MIAWIWLACAPEPSDVASTDAPPTDTPTVETAETATPPPPVGTLDGDELLSRLSIDLRGVRPTVEEFDRFRADPDSYDILVDEYLHDPRFSRHVADLWSQVLLNRLGDFFILPDAYERQGFTRNEVLDTAGEEPLQMLMYVIDHDLPYTDWVTGDWTMADETMAAISPIERESDAPGWQRAHYVDDRPAAGVLSVNGVWWLKGSMINNLNRGRANYLSRVFVCEDYLEREVPFVPDGALATPDGVADAIHTNAGCTTCHDSLDPLAGHFFGFWWTFAEQSVPEVYAWYHPERELLSDSLIGRPAAYLGVPTGGLVALGDAVAADPRYTRCFVRRAWELTTRTDVDALAMDLEPLDEAFAASGWNVREAFRALVHLPAWQGYDPRAPRRLVTPETLASIVEDLTGFAWTRDGRDLVNTRRNYALQAGAADGDWVPATSTSATVTTVLVQERLAEASARYVVGHDADHPGERTLFGEATTFTETTADQPATREQLAALVLRTHGRRVAPDDPFVNALVELWDAALALSGDPRAAWTTVVSVLLRDPALVVY